MPVAEVCQRLAHHAREIPTHPAVVAASNRAITYQELHRQVERQAAAFDAAGLRPGDPVGLTLASGSDAVAALLAALQAGLVAVWIEADQPTHQRQAILADGAPRGLVLSVEDELSSRGDDSALAVETAALIRIDRSGDACVSRMATPTSAQRTMPPGTACLVYLSGPTEIPKVVAQPRGSLESCARWLADEFTLAQRARLLQWARLATSTGYVEVLATVLAGATLVVPPDPVKRHPERMAEWLVAEQPTHVLTVPSRCRQLLMVREDRGDPPLRSVRAVGFHGEILAADLVQRAREHFPEAALRNLYGGDACPFVTCFRVPEDIGRSTVPVGRVIPGQEVILLDDDGAPVVEGAVGEICVVGPLPPDDGRKADAGRYRTSDLGLCLPDGDLVLLGRREEQLELGGVRLDLGEIEAALQAHPQVANAAVRAFGDGGAPGRLVAYIESRPGRSVDVSDLHAQLTSRLSPGMVPAAYVVLDQLPLTSTGTIDRRRLPDPRTLTGEASDTEDGALLVTETERQLGTIWRKLLELDLVGPEDDFFAVGGNSLLAPVVTSVVADTLGVELPVRAVFEHPRLRDLAGRIDVERAALGPQ